MTDLVTDDNLSPTISARQWGGGRIELAKAGDRAVLVQRWEGGLIRRYARTGILEMFLKLDGATDERIGAYANKSGLLRLCKHGEPLGLCGELLRWNGFQCERVEHWRRWVVRLRAIVQIGAILRAGSKPSVALVDDLLGELRHLEVATVKEALLRPESGVNAITPRSLGNFDRRWWFCQFVNDLLTFQALLTPGARDRKTLTVEYGPGGLFAVLVLQAALAATGNPSLVVCDNCGRPYRAKRRPPAGRRSYCPSRECRVLAAQRDAARAFRQRRSNNNTGRRKRSD